MHLLDCYFFAPSAPFVVGFVGVAAGVSSVWFGTRKRSFLRNVSGGVAVLAVLLTLASRYGILFYPAGCGADTMAMGLHGGRVVVADRRTVRELLPDTESEPLSEDVLRLHVMDADTGALRCRTVAGLQARLLDVLDGEAWIAAAGFRSEARWSLRSVKRMRLDDCVMEEVLASNWAKGMPELSAGVHERTYAGRGTLRLVTNDGAIFDLDMRSRTLSQLRGVPAAPGGSSTTVHREETELPRGYASISSGGHSDFRRIGRLREDGRDYRWVSKEVYARPRPLTLHPETSDLLLAHRATHEGSGMRVTLLAAEGGVRWTKPVEALLGADASAAEDDLLAVPAKDGFVLTRGGAVALLSWEGDVSWTQRL